MQRIDLQPILLSDVRVVRKAVSEVEVRCRKNLMDVEKCLRSLREVDSREGDLIVTIHSADAGSRYHNLKDGTVASFIRAHGVWYIRNVYRTNSNMLGWGLWVGCEVQQYPYGAFVRFTRYEIELADDAKSLA